MSFTAKDVLEVKMADGSVFCCSYDDRSSIDARVNAYIESGKTRDEIIYVHGIVGEQIAILASYIVSWAPATAAIRRGMLEHEADIEREEEEVRKELGQGDWS